MDHETFEMVFERQVERCRQMLVTKGIEYATADRLHNFRTAAALQGESLEGALAGMMAKHTVSLFDMMTSAKEYGTAVWDEKITDHLNYLFLLRAIVEENISGNIPARVVSYMNESNYTKEA